MMLDIPYRQIGTAAGGTYLTIGDICLNKAY